MNHCSEIEGYQRQSRGVDNFSLNSIFEVGMARENLRARQDFLSKAISALAP
jgi:hypothetical protein